ncbi:MAG: hypothetical protein L0Y58_17790 [Verrucomicrobia subdivision 3 bacterium]|nr:hypothetical protein [Limisphaerales bacterium]
MPVPFVALFLVNREQHFKSVLARFDFQPGLLQGGQFGVFLGPALQFLVTPLRISLRAAFCCFNGSKCASPTHIGMHAEGI